MAATSVQTVGDLVSEVAFQLCNDRTADANMTINIKQALHRQLQLLVRKHDHPAFITEDCLTLVSTQQDYDLPTDLMRVVADSVKYTDGDYVKPQYIAQTEWDRKNADYFVSSEDRPFYYTVRGKDGGCWNMRFLPAPSGSHEVKFSYVARPDAIRGALDATEIDARWPEEMVSALTYGAAMDFPNYLSQSQLVIFRERYNEALDDFGKSAPVVGQRYTRDQFGGNGGYGYGDVATMSANPFHLG